jgi:hypothetical protein
MFLLGFCTNFYTDTDTPQHTALTTPRRHNITVRCRLIEYQSNEELRNLQYKQLAGEAYSVRNYTPYSTRKSKPIRQR